MQHAVGRRVEWNESVVVTMLVSCELVHTASHAHGTALSCEEDILRSTKCQGKSASQVHSPINACRAVVIHPNKQLKYIGLYTHAD